MSEQKPCRSAEDRLVKLGVTVGSHNDEIGIAPNCEIQHSASCVAAFEDMESGLHAIVLEMRHERRPRIDRKSGVEGKSVSERVDLGGRRIIKKKKNIKAVKNSTTQKNRSRIKNNQTET